MALQAEPAELCELPTGVGMGVGAEGPAER